MWLGQVLKSSLGPLPFLKDGATDAENGDALQIEAVPLPPVIPTTHRPTVLADGSYATQVALPDSFAAPAMSSASTANLRCEGTLPPHPHPHPPTHPHNLSQM